MLFGSTIRVRYSRVGDERVCESRLVEVLGASARVDSIDGASIGDELRVELFDDNDSLVALGLARVEAIDGAGASLSLLSLGLNAALIEAATIATGVAEAREPARPPPIPRKPPPLPIPEEEELAPLIEPLAMPRTGMIIGIDLGTTNTCASYVKDGKPTIIPGRTGTSTIPSMITFDPDGTFHVGQRAADRQVLYPMRTVYGSKRLLGRTYRTELAMELQRHFAYPLGEAEGQRFGVRIDDRVISMDTIAARVLDEVRSSAEAHLGVPVDAAIITVPAYFSEVQRDAVRRAAAQAKLAVYRIVNEPTAAAVAYGHKEQTRARIAVWDFGGGTFDFSVVDVTEGQLEVIATGGDNFCGGSDFDDLLAGHILAEFLTSEGLAFDPTPQQIARLREAAEGAKKMLSVEHEALVELPEFTNNPRRALQVTVTRAEFAAITEPLVSRTLAIADEVMGRAGIAPSEIDDVLLIGGTTRVPAVQASVEGLFKRRPSKRINADEAVALGAALLAHEIGEGSAPALVDILPMSVGRGIANHGFEPIVTRYTSVPATKELTLNADVLGSVYVPLFQGESADVANNEYLCSVIVEDRSLWDGGRVTIRLSFDEHCVMAIDAIDARNGKALPIKLDRSRPVEDVLRDLGTFEGPPVEKWQLPVTPLGKVLGKLFKLFGR